MSTNQTTEGKIVQCIGAVIDIQFPRDQMPNIYEALTLVYNKTRQAAITKELSEIVGGAAAV